MIKPIDALTSKATFKRRKSASENPINRKTERNLALINAGGISLVTGALTTMIARSYTSSWKNAIGFGLGATAITMMFVAPHFLYKSGIKSYTKEKEMDVFMREKEVQRKLLKDAKHAIEENDPNVHEILKDYSKTKQG